MKKTVTANTKKYSVEVYFQLGEVACPYTLKLTDEQVRRFWKEAADEIIPVDVDVCEVIQTEEDWAGSCRIVWILLRMLRWQKSWGSQNLRCAVRRMFCNTSTRTSPKEGYLRSTGMAFVLWDRNLRRVHSGKTYKRVTFCLIISK